MRVAAVDPGKDGALVVLDTEGHVQGFLSHHAFTVPSGRGERREYVPAEMAAALRDVAPDLVVLEKASVRPTEGRGSGLTTGIGWGLWAGVCAGLGLPLVVVAPQTWQREVLRDAPGQGKARAVHVALARVPGLDLRPGRKVKPHEGLAEAACMAVWALAQHGLVPGKLAPQDETEDGGMI